MLLSRFWYVILALALGAAVAGLYLGMSVYNSASAHAMDQALAADTQVVSWYLNDDARRRSSLLLGICLDEAIRKNLSKASNTMGAVPKEAPQETRTALRKLLENMPQDARFDSLFAIDQYGRVVGQVGFDQSSGIQNFELGGYPVVADALHGWVRDDAWVLDGRIYLVVARPVEVDTGQMPAGAVVGLRIVDTEFARQLSRRTGAAVGFYADGTVKYKAAPEGFDPSQLETIVSDIGNLGQDKDYIEKGKSKPKVLMGDIGVIYSKMAGEAWDLGAGYVVGRPANVIANPTGFLQLADNKDKKAINWFVVAGLLLLAAGMGIISSIIEHTRPLHTLRVEAQRMAKGEVDSLQVSKFRGVYRKIASDLNDGTDKVAAKGGAPRKAADLESVLGPIPAQPSMSAFSFPLEASSSPAAARIQSSPSAQAQPPAPRPMVMPAPAGRPVIQQAPSSPQLPPAPKPPSAIQASPAARPPLPAAGRGPGAMAPPAPAAAADDDADDDSEEAATMVQMAPAGSGAAQGAESEELREWRGVYEDFIRTKSQCGEPTAGLTFEKFQQTLKKNRDTLVSKTNCKKVKFSVYVKEGRAALKASPVRV
jgi:hypothetical protein